MRVLSLIVAVFVGSLLGSAWGGVPVDTTPPVIEVLFPRDGMTGVSPLLQLVFTVTDNDCVDNSSLKLLVDDVDVAAQAEIAGNCNAQTFYYRAVPTLTLASSPQIAISVRDNAGNEATANLQVTITNGFDANLNSMPDDWEAEHGIVDGAADPDSDDLNNRYEAQFGSDPFAANDPFAGEDPYEPDNSADTAVWIALDNIHARSFHATGTATPDEDWAAFYANASEIISVEVRNQGLQSWAKIAIVDTDGVTILDEYPVEPSGFVDPDIILPITSNGVYFVRVTNRPQGAPGPDAFYELRISRDTLPDAPGAVVGYVSDAIAGDDLAGAEITLGHIGRPIAKSTARGEFILLNLDPGTYNVVIEHPAYRGDSQSVTVFTGQEAEVEFELCRQPLPGIPEDVDESTVVEAQDLQLVVNGVLGLGTKGLNLDVNNNCELEASDVQEVINYLLGIQ